MRDFCRQSISSCFLRSSIWCQRICYCCACSFVLPSLMISCCRAAICFSNFCRFSWMLPNYVLFQFLRICFNFFNFCWNWYILAPSGGLYDFHVSSTICLNFGFENQKASNQKGLLHHEPGRDHWSIMGQWSDPPCGKMEALKSPPRCIALSERRNLSNLEEIWLVPLCLLVQVKTPLVVGMSIRWLS